MNKKISSVYVFLLGIMFFVGMAGQALEWYERAANQDNSDAQFLLGRMCFDGQGIS